MWKAQGSSCTNQTRDPLTFAPNAQRVTTAGRMILGALHGAASLGP